MSDQKAQRKYLNQYTAAARNIELTAVAIEVLEQVGTNEAQRAIKILKSSQGAELKKLDAAAGKLGAPYPKAPS